MTRLSIAVFAVLALTPLTVSADGPGKNSPDVSSSISSGELMPTPEMWFYEQYQRHYQDPSTIVRQNAEFSAAQRRRRLATMRWFGLSNARPQCSSDPVHSGDWSAGWASNNTYYPWRWTAVGRP